MDKKRPIRSGRPVANWIMIGVAMLIMQVVLGGITRLTGSGLSITEWDVITGTLPPLNANQWVHEFQKYQLTPQYRLLNADFNLAAFKSIFFWEWLHRFWARLIAVAFAIPFIIFLFQRRIKPEMVKPLLILFLLGALQGTVGWIMVASGLTGDEVYVKPVKLAIHFVLACLLIGYAFWFGLNLTLKSGRVEDTGLKKFTCVVMSMLLIQLVFGALMAGYKAASAAPTWPDINGAFIPDSITNPGHWNNLLHNPVSLHFIHRTMAYLLVLLVIGWTFRAAKTHSTLIFYKARMVPILLVITQLLLGILTVLTSKYIRPGEWQQFEWLAASHQIVAIFLFLSLVAILFLLQGKQTLKSARALEPDAI